MRYLAAALISVSGLFPSMAFTQTIPVQAGEHRDFTRFVIRIPEGAGWNIETKIGRVDVSFSNFDGSFDIRTVFNRIPKTRVSNLEQIPTGLSFELQCACEVTSFIAEDRYLAIDFLEGPPLSAEDFRRRNEQHRTIAIRPSAFSYGDLLWSNEALGSQSAPMEPYPAEELVANTEEQQHSQVREQAVLAEARERMQNGVMSAATRGILRPATALPLPAKADESERVSRPDNHNTLADEPILDTLANSSNVSVTTSSDLADQAELAEPYQDSASCLSTKNLDIVGWASSDSGLSQIGSLRASLFNEIDRPRNEAILSLVRAFLYFGLGPEAKQVLAIDPDVEDKHPELIDIADVMEFGYARNPRVIHAGLNCPSEIAFWSVMSAKSIPETQQVNIEAVLRTLSQLPLHLREAFAPIVAARLLDIGEVDAAEAALRTLSRSMEELTAKANIASAELKIERGDRKSGTETLLSMIERGDAESPDAIIALMDEKVASGTSVSPDVALLVDSYAFQYSSSEMGDALLRAQIFSLAKSQQHRKSFELLDRHKENNFIAQKFAEIQEVLIKEITINSTDIVFLSTLVEYLDRISEGVDPSALLLAAERAFDLGFTEVANQVLDLIKNSERNEDARILSARILIEKGRFVDAVELVSDIESAEANGVRAVSNEKLGRNAAAKTIFDAIGDSASARRNGWLSEAWATEVDLEDPVFGPSRAVSGSELPSVDPQSEMLQNFSSLVEDSGSARQVLSELLESTVVE